MKFFSDLLKKRQKWLNPELIFYIGVFFLPFENFFFAPSAGWAAISPVIFAIYILLNLKRVFRAIVKLKNIILFFVFAVILGSLTAFLNNVSLLDYVNAFIPLALGAISLFSFYIFYDKKKDLKTVVDLVVIAYAICAVIGFFEYLTIRSGNTAFRDWIGTFMKRNYLLEGGTGRAQFFFTEPSFIGMHIFGILLPLFWLSRRKDLLFVIFLFLFESVYFGVGVRVIVDFAVVAMLYFGYLLIIHKKAKFIPLILLVLGLGFSYVYNNNLRIQKIVKDGIYADGSLASRYFRIQSSAIGYTKAPGKTLVGFGLGNAIEPIHLGYDEAASSYTSSFTREVDALDYRKTDFHDDSVAYSLYFRFISEFGLIMTLIAIIYLVKITKESRLPQRWLYLAIILYIYIQFESLGFYALWLFVATMLFTKKTDISERVLNLRIKDNLKRIRSHGK